MGHNAEVGRHLQDQLKFCVHFENAPAFTVISRREMRKWKICGAFVVYELFGLRCEHVSPARRERSADAAVFVSQRHRLCGRGGHELEGVTVEIVLLHPRSKGTVSLSAEGVGVEVRPCYLSDERDLSLLLRGFREVQRVFFGAAPFDGATTSGPRLSWSCLRGRRRVSWNASDERIKAHIAQNVRSQHNRVGTLRMGAVVDERLVLRGTTNVRVVDASVMPALTSGSLQAPIVVMAAKAADIIIADAEQSGECQEEQSRM